MTAFIPILYHTIINGIIVTRHIGSGAIDGTKISSYSGKIQRNTANTSETSMVIQAGWGRFEAPSGSAVNEAVTFPAAFSSAPIVLVSPGGGVSGSTSANYPGTSISYLDNMQAIANNQSTTGFTVSLTRSNSAAFSNTTTVFYTWIAIGPA